MWISAQAAIAGRWERGATMTGCCELANELTALSAACSLAAPEHTALAPEHTALSAVGAIIASEHTALANELTALSAFDTAPILGY